MSDARDHHGPRSQELLSRIIDHAPVGISYMDRDLVYAWVNKVQGALWGLPDEQVVGRSVFEVFGPEAEARLGPLLHGVVATGEPVFATAFPFDIPADGGTRRTYWDFTYQPVTGSDGAVEGVLVLAQEVSGRVENERLQRERLAALEASDRLKDQFLALLSHELRTPINVITGFGSILVDELDGPLNAEQAEHVRKILRGAEELERLIDDLLDMSRIQAGQVRLAREPLKPAALAEDVLRALRPAAAAKGLALEAEIAPGLPPVTADERRLGQVLGHLVGNAIKFTPAGGRIVVRLRQDGGQLRGEVADTGPGIAPAEVAKLFRPFMQLDAGDTRRGSGVGLGLSLARALIEAHGGTIGVETAAGRGATFWFAIPLTPEPAADADAAG